MAGAPADPLARRRISSALTFFRKFIFPALVVFVLARGFHNIYLAQQTDPTRVGFSPNELVAFFAFVIVVFGTLTWRFDLPLKAVEMDDEALYISNFLGEIRVPFRDVEDVRQGFWMSRQRVTIRLRTRTEFGQRIVFMPTLRWFALLDRHPIVRELRMAMLDGQAAASNTRE
jgi:hypothetical protein